MMTLGFAVRRLRVAAGFSQKQFAERLDVSQSYLSQIEGDRREPTIQLVRKMAGELGVPAVILFAAALSLPSSLGVDQQRQLESVLKDLVEAAGMNLAQISLSLPVAR